MRCIPEPKPCGRQWTALSCRIAARRRHVPYVALVRGRERSSDAAQGSPLGPRPASRHVGDLLLHPVALAALVVLVFNDHVAKDRWPSQVTGKASDVAGLLFFPLLLVSIVESVRWLFDRDGWPLGRRALLVTVLATGLGFAAVKLWGPAGDAYRVTNGLARWPLDAVPSLVRGEALPPVGIVNLTEDRTDLVALVALLGAWWTGCRVLDPPIARRMPGRSPHPRPGRD